MYMLEWLKYSQTWMHPDLQARLQDEYNACIWAANMSVQVLYAWTRHRRVTVYECQLARLLFSSTNSRQHPTICALALSGVLPCGKGVGLVHVCSAVAWHREAQ